jgi:16S rRNA (uracil1498-N3)-methyltransferase
MAWCNENTMMLNEAIDKQKPTLVLIGPEGDFTEHETQLALAKNFKTISLGNNILRTETAAIYATAVVNIILQK